MVAYITALLVLLIGLTAISLRRTYNYLPAIELKRQARAGDHDADTLYKAVAYGSSLRLFLWLVIGISIAVALGLFSVVAPAWLGGIAVAGIVWYAFAWAPRRRVTAHGAKLAILLTPLVAWVLRHVHRPLDWFSRTVVDWHHAGPHTGLYERADLVHLVEQQKEMSDSRIDQAELDIVLNALNFGEKIVVSAMVPKRAVKTVAETDEVGPILLDELYESKHSRFPVVAGDSVVGLVYLGSLVAARGGGSIKALMKTNLHYVHENQTLYQVLHAFLTTKQQLFIVINSHEEYVGVITLEDVIEQIIGQKIESEFTSYEDLRAVAGQRPE